MRLRNYQEDLFRIQALEFQYHMDTPEVFYNREDLWQFPREPTAPEGWPQYRRWHQDGALRHHDTSAWWTTGWVLSHAPHGCPAQREVMIAWLAAHCDLPDYGKLVACEFPKDKLVYGPYQVEARIDQNTEISV
jgi:uncharacterized protein